MVEPSVNANPTTIQPSPTPLSTTVPTPTNVPLHQQFGISKERVVPISEIELPQWAKDKNPFALTACATGESGKDGGRAIHAYRMYFGGKYGESLIIKGASEPTAGACYAMKVRYVRQAQYCPTNSPSTYRCTGSYHDYAELSSAGDPDMLIVPKSSLE